MELISVLRTAMLVLAAFGMLAEITLHIMDYYEKPSLSLFVSGPMLAIPAALVPLAKNLNFIKILASFVLHIILQVAIVWYLVESYVLSRDVFRYCQIPKLGKQITILTSPPTCEYSAMIVANIKLVPLTFYLFCVFVSEAYLCVIYFKKQIDSNLGLNAFKIHGCPKFRENE